MAQAGFKPCFIGSLSVRRFFISPERQNKSFKPCFIGSLSVRPPERAGEGRGDGFQTLFYWKSICSKSVLDEVGHDISGFKPCFIGSLSVRWNAKSNTFSYKQFQTLFYWKSICSTYFIPTSLYLISVSNLVLLEVYLFDNPAPDGRSGCKCFKPCFIGSLSVRRHQNRAFRCNLGFKPCFIGSLSVRYKLRPYNP